jgi:TfoX/Sxy family transcriptional regulator of competence genes
MPHDEKLAERVRDVLQHRVKADERHMFGGVAFMVRGHMCLGVANDDLVVRVGPERHEAALKKRGARPMDFTGKPLKGMVYVTKRALAQRRDIEHWADEAIGFVSELPAKTAKPKRAAKRSAKSRRVAARLAKHR